jgi:hypothetical protein
VGDSLPVATVHGGAARRLWSFIAAPPREPTAGTYAWVLTLAGASYVLHAAFFTLVILIGGDSLGVGLGAVAGMLLGLMVFMTTITAMAVAQVASRWLVTMPPARARRTGAALIAAVACAVEPIGTVFFRGLADADWLWSWGRWVIAGGLGALWGGWLADAHRHDLREPSGSSRA